MSSCPDIKSDKNSRLLMSKLARVQQPTYPRRKLPRILFRDKFETGNLMVSEFTHYPASSIDVIIYGPNL